MSEHDDLRVRLARLDPAPPSLDLVESPRAPELLERIMATPVLTDSGTSTTAKPPARRRAVLAWAAAVAVLAAGAATAGIALRGDRPTPGAAPTTLALSLPGSNVMSSCIQFDVSVLRDMSPAFAGTVTAVDDSQVVLDVDHWYAGGDADTVTLAMPYGGTSVAIDGVAFEMGKRYLVTAAGGTVNGCGFTGLATPDLERSFAEAFPG
jgi:hypothetical protein